MKKGLKIEKQPSGRRIAIGDIHGCAKTFQFLIENKIALKKEDQLFLLGDYIDKGKKSKEVLEYILELKQNGFSIFPLMGNHEYFILRDLAFCKNSNNQHQLKDIINSKDLLNSNGEIEHRFYNFIVNLPYFYELDQFILVHAGLDFEERFPLDDTSSMIYIRDFNLDREKINNKILIHGHTPISLDEIKNQINSHQQLGKINLDNGCVWKNHPQKQQMNFGHLCGLDLDEMKLYAIENMD